MKKTMEKQSESEKNLRQWNAFDSWNEFLLLSKSILSVEIHTKIFGAWYLQIEKVGK